MSSSKSRSSKSSPPSALSPSSQTAPLSLSVSGLHKVYRLYDKPIHRLFELLTRRTRHRPFVALDGVDLELPKGSALGIIGQNGAGKSTLMKVLAGVTQPTSGAVEIRGRTAAILELGSGFHPEFTGRQNIRLNAAMLGLSERDLDEREPEIIGFSELADAIDQPVKTYSTGMAMRLGFAIATHVDAEILIVDEALAVGDGYFQKKCFLRMRDFLDRGNTLVFCSHAMYYVTSLCNQGLWLRDGRIEASGDVHRVVQDYEAFLQRKERKELEPGPDEGEPRPEVLGRLRAIRVSDGAGGVPAGEPPTFASKDAVRIEVDWESFSDTAQFHLGVAIDRMDEVNAITFATHIEGLEPRQGLGRWTTRVQVPSLPLLQGDFSIHVFLLDEDGLHIYDRRLAPAAFRVEGTVWRLGMIDTEHSWSFDR